MKELTFREIDGRCGCYWSLIAVLGVFILAGLGAFAYIEHEGHDVTGMTNQFAWAGGHVTSIFMIAAGAGVFVVAAAASVFNRSIYKPIAPLAGLLAIALLIGGLAVMVLDLGRPDRLQVAMTHFNFKSTIASNIMRYQGFMALVALYLWFMMDRRFTKWAKPVAVVAFLWSLTLSSGVGLEFAFLVAREAYDAAVMAPMMVAFSFMYGTAVLILTVIVTYTYSGRPLGDALLTRLKSLLAIFVAAGLYFVIVHYLTMAYGTEHHGFVSFILFDGGKITNAFWYGQIGLGLVIPLILFYAPTFAKSRPAIAAGAAMVIIGGFCQLYVTLIGGQAYPMNLFPGFEAASSFGDGMIGLYDLTLVEALLALTSIPIALIMVSFGVKFLRFLPVSLEDEIVDPHHKLHADG